MKNNALFTLQEKLALKDMGLSLTDLSRKYQKARYRALNRGVGIRPIYSFYREYLKQLVELAAKLGTTPKDLLPLIDIHSIEGYTKFRLILRKEHKLLHSAEAQRKAKAILESGVMTCTHCGKEQKLEHFTKSKKTYSGYIKKCKECDRRIRKEQKELKREVA